MNVFESADTRALQPFEPDPDAVYTIEVAANLTQVGRHQIVVYYKEGLVSPVVAPECGGYYFNDEGVRTLRRLDYLQHGCGINLAGVRMILALEQEVERLREEARFLREQ